MSTDPALRPERPVSIPVLILVYLAYMLFGVVLVAIIYMVAERFLTSSPQSSAMGVLIPMLAAMAMTSFWAGREGRPSGRRQWGFAFIAAVLTVLINGALVWYVAASGAIPELRFTGGLSKDDLMFGGILAAFLLVLLVLVIRGGFWIGFNSWEKQQARLAAKNRTPR